MAKEITETQKLNELLPVVIPKCEVSRVSATFDKALTFDDWKHVGIQLAAINGCCLWWIGDWLLHGVKAYGDKTEAAKENCEALGYSNPDTLRQAVWVSERVVDRSTSLSWRHHYEVAALCTSDQKRFLKLAEKGDGSKQWSVSQLRQAIREANGEYSDNDAGKTEGINVMKCSLDLHRFYSQLDKKQPIEQLPIERRKLLWNDSEKLYGYLTRLKESL